MTRQAPPTTTKHLLLVVNVFVLVSKPVTSAANDGEPTLTVNITEDCSPTSGVDFTVEMMGANRDQWPARVTVEEYDGHHVKKVCQVGYSNGVCANNDMCQCVGTANNGTQFKFSMQYRKKKDTSKFRAVIFDADEEEKIEQKFELQGLPKVRITMDGTEDMLAIPGMCRLSLFEGTKHTLSICHEGLIMASLVIIRNEKGVASSYKKPCLQYEFYQDHPLEKFTFFYMDKCTERTKIPCNITGLDPDNFTIPSCEFCDSRSMVDWLVVMKWLLPSTVLSLISCSVIIFYVRSPVDEFGYYVEKSFESMRSLSRSQSTKSVKSVKKSHDHLLSGQGTPKKSTTVQSVPMQGKISAEEPQAISFEGSLIL